MTKPSNEIITKTNLQLDEPAKMVEATTEITSESAFVVYNPTIEPIQERGTKALADETLETFPEKMKKALIGLYDLEQSNETEKQLSIDLNLYQMENH